MIINKILNVDDYYYDLFMSISGTLTGFSVNELQSTGLAEIYYEHILSQIKTATCLEFLNLTKSILESSCNQEQLRIAIQFEIMADYQSKPQLYAKGIVFNQSYTNLFDAIQAVEDGDAKELENPLGICTL